MTLLVLDTSALVALLADEPTAPALRAALRLYPERLVSAGTLTELLLVSRRVFGAGGSGHAERLLGVLGAQIVPVDEPLARAGSRALAQWREGVHPAGLNYGDSFAHTLAKRLDAPLLFVGQGFSQTDVRWPDPVRDQLHG